MDGACGHALLKPGLLQRESVLAVVAVVEQFSRLAIALHADQRPARGRVEHNHLVGKNHSHLKGCVGRGPLFLEDFAVHQAVARRELVTQFSGRGLGKPVACVQGERPEEEDR